MSIVSLQVPLGNPGYETGWYHNPASGETQYYDATADQWYILVAGFLYPMATQWVDAVTVNPSAPIGVSVGDTVRIEASFYHQGPAGTYELYGAIGVGAFSPGTGDDYGAFIEGSPAGRKSISLGSDSSPKLYTDKYVDVVVPSSCNGTPIEGKLAAIYVKIVDGVSLELYKTLSVYLRGALSVAGVEAVFSNLEIVDWNRV